MSRLAIVSLKLSATHFSLPNWISSPSLELCNLPKISAVDLESILHTGMFTEKQIDR